MLKNHFKDWKKIYKILTALGFLILLVVVALVVLERTNVIDLYNTNANQNNKTPSGETNSNTANTDSQDSAASIGEPSVKQLTTNPTPTEDTKSITITRATVKNNTLTVAAIVNNATALDICTLVISKNGQAEVKLSKPVVYQTSYYSCQNFVYDTTQLPTNGNWQVKVIINDDPLEGQSDVQEITI